MWHEHIIIEDLLLLLIVVVVMVRPLKLLASSAVILADDHDDDDVDVWWWYIYNTLLNDLILNNDNNNGVVYDHTNPFPLPPPTRKKDAKRYGGLAGSSWRKWLIWGRWYYKADWLIIFKLSSNSGRIFFYFLLWKEIDDIYCCRCGYCCCGCSSCRHYYY